MGMSPLCRLELYLLDRDGVRRDAKHAGLFAGCGTETSGELRKVVRRVEAFSGARPISPIDQIVPLWDEVPQRASLVAEWDATVHASRRLDAQMLLAERFIDLAPVSHPDLDAPSAGKLPIVLEEAGSITHGPPP